MTLNNTQTLVHTCYGEPNTKNSKGIRFCIHEARVTNYIMILKTTPVLTRRLKLKYKDTYFRCKNVFDTKTNHSYFCV